VLAFQQLLEKGAEDVQLVLIGRPGNAYPKVAPMIDGRRIIHLGYLDDERLRQYIANALAVIFVSRYEGFGLPAVEAYMLNDTVIASKGNSVGEISRGFALQVDENSVDALAQAMRDVLAGRQPKPVRSRDDVLASYSWDEAARRMTALFLSSVHSNGPVPPSR
jgi:alpha-1,3-rhamnosyl/mannosyltransferase